MMTRDHDYAGYLMADVRKLSQDCTVPADACSTFRAFFVDLREFEQDLHQNIHRENNILFPQAILLESSSV